MLHLFLTSGICAGFTYCFQYRGVKYVGEKVLQILGVLAVFRGYVLRYSSILSGLRTASAASTRSISGLCTADTPGTSIYMFRGLTLYCGFSQDCKYFGVRYGRLQVPQVFRGSILRVLAVFRGSVLQILQVLQAFRGLILFVDTPSTSKYFGVRYFGILPSTSKYVGVLNFK